MKSLDKVIRNNWHNDKPVLLEIGIHISTTIKRYRQLGYKVTPFFILEEPETVVSRIISRGGNRVENVISRYQRILSLSKVLAHHVDKADSMVEYLTEYGKKTFRNRHDSGIST